MYKDITTQRRNCVKTINAGRSIPYPSLLIPDPQKKKTNKKKDGQIQNTSRKRQKHLQPCSLTFVVKNTAKCSSQALISHHLSKPFSYIYLSTTVEFVQYSLENKLRHA